MTTSSDRQPLYCQNTFYKQFLSVYKFTVNVQNPNTFGFQTGPHRSVQNCFEQAKRLKSEQLVIERSDFGVYSIN